MNKRNISRKNLMAVAVFCFVVAVFLFFGMLADFLSAGKSLHQPVTAAQAADNRNTNAIADQIFIVLVPLVIVFLVYIAYLINNIVKNLNGTSVCKHPNPDCEYRCKYFQ
ncbi:MAG: hypothetical protein AB1546_05225 [bacterium]